MVYRLREKLGLRWMYTGVILHSTADDLVRFGLLELLLEIISDALQNGDSREKRLDALFEYDYPVFDPHLVLCYSRCVDVY